MRLALRQLFKSPGIALIAIATLALGIGVCATMFSIVRAVLLKPLPFHEPDRLVWIENSGTDGLSARTSRADTLNGWRAQSQSFTALAAWFAFSDYGSLIMSGTGEPERLREASVSENFLPTLGVQPLLGRNFTAAEAAWQGEPGTFPARIHVVMLSHGFWQRRFGGDPEVIGRQLTLNGNAATIVGVLPRAFDFDATFSPGNEVDIMTLFPLTDETARWGNTVFGIGRLRPGVSLEQAQAELEVINGRLAQTLPNPYGFGARVSSLEDAVRGKFRSTFVILTIAVACVLAIACVNLSNLLLARMNGRRQEFAVRVSLGAQRRHLVRQAITESLLLAFAGALVALPFAGLATDALARLETFGVPLLQDASLDPVAVIVTLGVTTLAGILCGVLPALYVSRAPNAGALQHASQQRSAGRSVVFSRHALIVIEVALACVLLISAGLLIRSFNAVLNVDLGFQPQHAMAWRLATTRSFNSSTEATAYHDGIVARISALPGVISAGLTDTLPLSRNRTWGAGAKGVEYEQGEFPIAFPRMIDQHYLRTMQIPLLRGRLFDERDGPDAPRTVIINANLAERLVPGRDALGQVINVNGGSTVIGIVANVKHGALEQNSGSEMYLDYRQCTDWSALDLVVRSSRPQNALVSEVRAVLAEYDPLLARGEMQTLDHLVDNAVAPRRLITQMLGVFSGLALALAALGIYGVVAYSVSQRTQEIGIRMAIGAQRGDVLRLVLRSGLVLVGVGVVIGLAASFAVARLLHSLLYGVGVHDPMVFSTIAVLLLGVAIIACLLPALRATKVDPLVALRGD